MGPFGRPHKRLHRTTLAGAATNVTTRSKAGYIGPNLVIHGRLSGRGEIVVDGLLEGDVTVEGVVKVGAVGTIKAAVEADVVDVAGVLKGAVTGMEEVAVREGGTIDGDVRAPRVAIDDGGALHGGIQMDFEIERGDE